MITTFIKSWYLHTFNPSHLFNTPGYFYYFSVLQQTLSQLPLLNLTLYPCCFGVEWMWLLLLWLFSPIEPPYCAGSSSPRANRDCVKASLCTRSQSWTHTSWRVLLWANNFCRTPDYKESHINISKEATSESVQRNIINNQGMKKL